MIYAAGENSDLRSIDTGVLIHGKTHYQGFYPSTDPHSSFYKNSLK
jgi:hypothetical protein